MKRFCLAVSLSVCLLVQSCLNDSELNSTTEEEYCYV